MMHEFKVQYKFKDTDEWIDIPGGECFDQYLLALTFIQTEAKSGQYAEWDRLRIYDPEDGKAFSWDVWMLVD